MSWDPAADHRMFVGQIGEWQVEAVYEVQPGDNFGWSRREGPFRVQDRELYPLPPGDEGLGYTYPVAAYGHEREPDQVGWTAGQDTVEDLPDETLLFLLGSRYCETDLLSDTAWQLFSGTTPGRPRVQTICDFVHRHIRFDYQRARATRSAREVFDERVGVCRDFAHLAIAFCRCMNIPARYCTGYLSDIGTPPPHPPGDFAAWFEAWIGGRWYLFDPRNNVPRIGRILMARGRDASDVAIATTFGPNSLQSFRVWTDEIGGPAG